MSDEPTGRDYYRMPQTEQPTLRDYFAAHALQGMLSCQDFVNEAIKANGNRSREEVRTDMAMWAYRQADAMLATREGGLA